MGGPVRLVVLNDNRPGPGLRNKWGWSLYIETPGSAAVFDADTEPEVICHNADRLGVDLSRAGFAVLSHEHWDHYGGMPCLAERRPGITVYAPMGLHLWRRGLNVNLVELRDGARPLPGFTITPALKAGIILEHALAVQLDGESMIVVVGCSHPGVDELTRAAIDATGLEPLLVIGGYHGPSKSTLDRLMGMARYVSPAHCSGEAAVRYIQREYPGRLVMVRTGTTLIIEPGTHRITVRDPA